MESIKQEIISCIYENGENLITGPVLQEVLLDMVDDTNAKVASGSVPGDLVEKTGSWDDAADWVEDNSGSLVHDTDLDGYATERWVEDQGYLKEVPEGYATTESLNELSESVAELSSSIPSVDLSGYATTESVNEATQSVKDWVEAKHYLTTASLSGSVTEESVQFMINDSTASMKEWVENQNYATETFVSESIASLDIPSIEGLATTESLNQLSESVANDFANLDIPDTSGFVTTQSYNQDSASFDERINSISGSDLSGYATTESLNLLSESVAEDLEGKADKSELPDLTGYATEQWVQEQGYLTEHQDISGLATTSSVTSLSESIALDLEGKANTGDIPDISGLATTESVNNLSESVANDFANLNIPDVSGLATTSSVNSLSESVATDILGLSESIAAITGSDLSGYVTTASYNTDSASFDQRINNITGSSVDLSGYATTASVNDFSESVAQDVANLSASIAAITGSSEATASIANKVAHKLTFGTSISKSADTFDGSEDVIIDVNVSTLVNRVVSQSVSASIPILSSSFVTTESYNTDSASFNSRISTISNNTVWKRGTGVNSVRLTYEDTSKGTASVAHGNVSYADGNYSHAEGNHTSASGEYSHAEGTNTQTLGSGSHAEGLYTTASKNYSHAEGSGSLASGVYSHAEGASTIASGGYSHAEGFNAKAFGSGSHAEGWHTRAIGWGSHAEGIDVTSSGANSHAEGERTFAEGHISHAEGLFTTASGTGSHSEGEGTWAVNWAEHVQGRCNATASGQIFSIGVGSGSYRNPEQIDFYDVWDRRNALSVITCSSEDGYAKVYIMGVGPDWNRYDGTNPEPGVNDVASLMNQIGVVPDYLDIPNKLTVGSLSGTGNAGTYSIVAGENCWCAGYGQAVFGRENYATSDAAFSTITGFRCRGEAMSVFTAGCRSTGSANFSTAIGFGAEATALGQVVLGSFNELDASGSLGSTGSYAVILANGKSSTWDQDDPGTVTRQNGLALKWDGGIDIQYSGSIITLQNKIAELEARIAALESGSNA